MTKFSHASLFSGLNHLLDITMAPEYSAVCGYTERDLDAVFAPELEGLDRDAIRDWYHGYNWLGEKVYNPVSILLLFRQREFGAYWFETGLPRFLVNMLLKRRVSPVDLERMWANSHLLSGFEPGDIPAVALLFRTGCLTIGGKTLVGGLPHYKLGYPNREVRQSLNESLLRYLVKDGTRQAANSLRLYELLGKRDFEGMRNLFQAFFSSIPYEWYTNNDIANYEGYYASVFYSYFAALGLDVTVEDSTSHGRLDMAVRFGRDVYLFEFKVVEMAPEGAALAQLREKGYADKYRDAASEIFLVGVEFSRETRNVVGFEVG